MLVQKNKKLSANNAKDANKSLLNHSSGSIVAWAVGCAVRTEKKIIHGCFMVRTAHPTDLAYDLRLHLNTDEVSFKF